MKWIILILFLFTGTIKINGTRGKQRDNVSKVALWNPTNLKAQKAEIVREELHKSLDHKLPDVTNQAQAEVKQLNTLITSAVSKNAYINENFRSPDESILKHKTYKRRDSIFNLGSTTQPANSTILDDIAITHNVIESNIISDFLNQTTNTTIWHPNLISKTHLNRELLILNSVKQNFNYNFENLTNIELWKLIKTNLSTNLLIGLTRDQINNISKLNLITENGFNFTFSRSIPFSKLINEFEIIKSALNNYLVTIEDNTLINFYKIAESNDVYELQKISEINLHKQIVLFKLVYKRLDKIRLIFVTDFNGSISADLYDFEIRSLFNFWLIKTIPLSTSCYSIAILDTGRDYIMAFQQTNQVTVYQYDNDVFKQLDTIKTDMVTDVSGFSMGGYSYLAVGGHNPQILRYYRGQLHRQTMLSQSFGLVEKWFPISARTHRDDLLLLVQHRIDFSTHSLIVLEALIWDGEAFNIVPTTPCYRNEIMSHYGITCMIDIEQETDIGGSITIQHGKNISILVPRGDEASQLFDLNIELAPVPNPLQQDINEFNSIYKILSALVDQFNNSMQQIQNTIDNAINLEEYTMISGNWEIETLEFANTFVDNDVKIGTVYVGDVPISKQESEFYLPFMEDILDAASKKFYDPNIRPKRQEQTADNDIKFDFLNGIPADELVFATEDTIELNGIQEFENSVYVGNDVIMSNDSKINGISIRQDTINSDSEVVLPAVNCDEVEILENLHVMNDINGKEFNQENMGRLLDDGTRSTIHVDEMIVGGDLNFTRLNNVDFDNFIKNIIFKNLPTRVDSLSIDGNILVHTEFGLKNINEMQFPGDFVFRNSSSQQDIILGHKVFTKNLVTNQIDTDGEINGIKPHKIVTLGDKQFIPGEITFSQIEVTESLEVNGTIKFQNLDKFLENPTMTQTKVINSSCIFNEFEVEGNVYLNEIEKINLDSILENVLYTDQQEEFLNVNALKIFDVVYVETDHFKISSNFINNKYNLDTYVTKTDSQILSVNYLNGTIKLNTVTLAGLFNGINVTELDLNSIKTVGDQYIDKRIKFQHAIVAKELKILEKINKKPINQLIDIKLSIDGNIRIDSNFEIENLEITHLTTNGNIQSENGEVNQINLNEFNKIRFSLSRPQTIPGKFLITSAIVDGDLTPIFLNDISLNNFNALIENKNNIVSDILSGKVPIHNLIVNGNVSIKTVNGFNMNNIIQNVIWLDRPNTISNRLTFLDEVVIYSDIEVLSQINTKYNLNTIFDHLVYRDQPTIIDEKKVFTNGIKIYGDYATDYINDIAFRDLLLSNEMNHVKNKIIIKGNLQVNNLNAPYINDFEMNELTSLYHFDEESKTHYLNIENVNFVSPQQASLLYINGSINDVFNADEFLANIIQLDKPPIHFDGLVKLFQYKLTFLKNLVVENLNSIDLENYFEHLVHVDEKDPVAFKGNLEFVEEITADHMTIGGDLITNQILNYDPQQWLKNNYYINENVYVKTPLKFERGTFHAAAMSVHFLNSIDMTKVLTYNTEQFFDADFHVSELVSLVPVHVGGLVNEISLSKELQNTLMLTGNTSIKIPLRIKNLNVLNAIKTPQLINDKLISDIIKIESHIIVQNPISFNEIQTPSVIAHGNDISGIDFELWYIQSLWKRGRETQTVVSKYTISNVAIGQGGIHGTELVNNKSMNEIVETRNRDQLKLVNEVSAYRKETEFICISLRHLIKSSKHQIYYVKYFDNRIILENGISKIVTKLFFVLKHETYLLISSVDCHTTIYIWDADAVDFQEVLKFQSGFVSEWRQIHGRSSNQTVLVSYSNANGVGCTKIGVYLWIFNGNSILENSAVLIHPEYNIKSIWTSDKFVKNVFLIAEDHNREPNIFQIDDHGRVENQWPLPINHRRLRFLPTELVFHLALSDGSQLFLINNYKIHDNRVKRHNWDLLNFKNLLKLGNAKLMGTENSIVKIGSKGDNNVNSGLSGFHDQNSIVGCTQEAATTESVANVGDVQSTTSSPIVNSQSESLGYTVERIIDNIFEKIVKISGKSVKSVGNNTLGSQKIDDKPTSEIVAHNISNNIADTTLNAISKIESAKFQIEKNEEVGDPIGIDKEEFTKTISVSFPHVKNISKHVILSSSNALNIIQRLGDLASNLNSSQSEFLNSESVSTINDGYKSVEKVTEAMIDTTVNTLLHANELANKFELNNDNYDSEMTNMAARETQDFQPILNGNLTTNNLIVGAFVDTVEIKSITKNVESKGITNSTDINILNGPPKIENAPGEFFIEPNPTIESNTTNKLIVGTPLDIAYAEIEKTSKNLVDTGIKTIADFQDFTDRTKNSEILGDPFIVESESDEFVIAPNPTVDGDTRINNSIFGAPVNVSAERDAITENLEDPSINNFTDIAVLKHESKIEKTADKLVITNNSIICSNITTNNSIVSTPLDTAYTEVEKTTKKLLDAGIKTIVDLEGVNERISNPEPVGNKSKIENETDEFVIAPNRTINSNTTDTNSIVGTPLDTAYAEIEKTAKNLVDTGIKTIADLEDSNARINKPETVGDTFEIKSKKDEIIIAPNPTINCNTTANNSMVGTPLETAEIEKTAKNLVDTGIKTIADLEDFNARISNPEVVGDATEIGSKEDEIVIAPNPTINCNTRANNSMVGTPLEAAYAEIEKTAKNLVDTGIKTIADLEDFNARISNPEVVGDATEIGSKEDDMVIAQNLTINSNTTANNSMVGIPLDTAYAEIEKTAKNLVDTGIKTIADLEDFNARISNPEAVGDTSEIGNELEEIVIAPNPMIESNTTTNDPVKTSANTVPITDNLNDTTVNHFTNATICSITANNTIVDTLPNTEKETPEKNFMDRHIKTIIDFKDVNEIIDISKTVEYLSKIETEPDEFVIAPNPSYTTPLTVQATEQSKYNLGANMFNIIRRSRIGNKETKIVSSPAPQAKDNDENIEHPTIGQEITYYGVIASENNHIPEKGKGEIVILYVGENKNRRMLTAVSTKTNTSTIPGKHDTIKIYDDILEGKIYQEIQASKPTGLTALHIGDQTLLAFLEDNVVIQLLIYHGIEGFKNFNEYKLPMIASHLSTITLPGYGLFACPRHFLVVTFTNKLWFLESVMEGNCGVDADLDCTFSMRSVDNL